MGMWMKAFQLLCAFAGGSFVIWLGVTNGYIIGVNALFAACLGTWLVARLRGGTEQAESADIISSE